MRPTYLIPMLFVFLWSTAYIAFKLCADYSEPATFVLLRVSIAALLLAAIVLFAKLTWPERIIDFVHSSVVGILIHGIYAGGIFAAIYHGMNAGVCALILGLQPLVTTAISISWLNESITRLKSVGILSGFLGVVLLITYGDGGLADGGLQESDRFTGNLNTLGTILCFMSLMAISIGMVYQKRYCTKTELLPGTCIQFSAAAMFMLPFAMTTETMSINWSWGFILGLMWLVLAVSVGAMSLLMVLVRQGETGSVSSLFYLVPPLVAIEAWLFFDEQLNLVAVLAMLLCMLGVMLVGNSSRPPPRVKSREHPV